MRPRLARAAVLLGLLAGCIDSPSEPTPPPLEVEMSETNFTLPPSSAEQTVTVTVTRAPGFNRSYILRVQVPAAIQASLDAVPTNAAVVTTTLRFRTLATASVGQ